MLWEAATYKDLDEFNQDAELRYETFRPMIPDGPAEAYWQVMHLNVNKNGSVLVLWRRDATGRKV